MTATQPDSLAGHLAPDQSLAKWDQLHGDHDVSSALARRTSLPNGVTVDIHGYFGVDFEVWRRPRRLRLSSRSAR
jgi:hypothetical protein